MSIQKLRVQVPSVPPNLFPVSTSPRGRESVAAPAAAGRGRASGDSHLAYVHALSRKGESFGNLWVSSQAGLRHLPFKQGMREFKSHLAHQRERRYFGAWRSWSIALALGARGRRFESFRSDQIYGLKVLKDSTPALQAGGWSSSLHQSIK